jgi:hypothetical protein
MDLLSAVFERTIDSKSNVERSFSVIDAGEGKKVKQFFILTALERMSVRVVARIRPPGKAELERDNIITVEQAQGDGANATIVKIPNPKNEAELFSFQFNSVYDQSATQQQIFENEGKYSGIAWVEQILISTCSLAYS